MKSIKVKSYNKLIENIIVEDSIKLDGDTNNWNGKLKKRIVDAIRLSKECKAAAEIARQNGNDEDAAWLDQRAVDYAEAAAHWNQDMLADDEETSESESGKDTQSSEAEKAANAAANARQSASSAREAAEKAKQNAANAASSGEGNGEAQKAAEQAAEQAEQAAEQAEKAAEEAQQHADAAKEAEASGDSEKAKSEAEKAKEAADKAKDAADKAEKAANGNGSQDKSEKGNGENSSDDSNEDSSNSDGGPQDSKDSDRNKSSSNGSESNGSDENAETGDEAGEQSTDDAGNDNGKGSSKSDSGKSGKQDSSSQSDSENSSESDSENEGGDSESNSEENSDGSNEDSESEENESDEAPVKDPFADDEDIPSFPGMGQQGEEPREAGIDDIIKQLSKLDGEAKRGAIDGLTDLVSGKKNESLSEAFKKGIRDFSDEEWDDMSDETIDRIEKVKKVDTIDNVDEIKADFKSWSDNPIVRQELEDEEKQNIQKDVLAQRASEKEVEKYGNLPTLKDFEIDFENCIRDQVEMVMKDYQDYSEINPEYEDEDIIMKADVQKIIPSEEIPSIAIFFDQSTSWDSSDVAKGQRAIATVKQKYVDTGLCTLDIWYFANYVGRTPHGIGGGTTAWPYIVQTIADHDYKNVIIMTDSDMNDWNNHGESYTVEGCVWWIWRQGYRAPNLPKQVKGMQHNYECEFR